MAETALSTCEPLYRTPEPTERTSPGCWFDDAAVDRVVAALGAFKHSKGRWAGAPLELQQWQLDDFVAPVFGWKHEDGTRVVRTAYLEVPRKNGKSTISSGLALVLFLADGEQGAEVYAAAASRDQARIVFEEAKRMVSSAAQLRGKVEPLRSEIRAPATGSTFKVLSKAAEAAHGLNVSGAVIDELHVHKSRDLVDAIETGTPSREQPLVIIITTADEGDEGTIYAEKHDYTVSLAEGTAVDPTFYGVIFAAEPDADPFAEATWRAANPGFGVTVDPGYLRKEAAKARAVPSYLPTFQRLHLNQRVRSEARWMDLGSWDRTAGIVDEHALAGLECFGGLDLASTSDFAAWVLCFPDDDGNVTVLPRLFLPSAALERRASSKMGRTFETWAERGLITVTDGEVTDFETIERRILDDAEQFELHEFAFDPWQGEYLRQRLDDQGLTGWKCPQGVAHLSGPTKAVERLVGRRQLIHGGHSPLRWMISNVIAKSDAQGNIRPDKSRSKDKIDGAVALIMGIASTFRERDETTMADPEFMSL